MGATSEQTAQPRPLAAAWGALGTTALVQVTDGAALAAATAILDRQLRELDLAASRFRDDSEISALQRRGGARTEVSPLLVELIAQALRAARITDGLVSPALGWALVAAGYDRDFDELAVADGRAGDAASAPDSDDSRGHRLVVARVARRPRIRAARQDWRAIELDREAGTVRLPAGMRLDLGASAKAYAADRAASTIAAATGAGVLVSLGGDIATAGQPPAGGWQVHVSDDHRTVGGPGQRVAITSGALATSSTTVRRWRHRGRSQHHIIDPRSGQPATSCWRTVSATAATCVDANIATTAAIVLSEQAVPWLEQAGIAARLVAVDGAIRNVCGWPGQAR
jgi:thiamine biosynthesis lipoprotein